jgi:hypothetical protein
MTSTTPGRRFYEEQLAYLVARDTDTMVDQHYAPDGEIVAFDFIVKGSDALKKFFRDYLEMLGYIRLISTDKFAETQDSIFFEATVETRQGVGRVYDAFVLKDGRITHHFSGSK